MITHPSCPHRLLFLWLLLVLSAGIPLSSFAKRSGPVPVTPVVEAGIRYSAPLDNGRKAIIRAADAATGKVLWEVMVYEVTIDPELEADVQWVFIRNIKLEKGSLRISDERGRVFLMDLKTRRVVPQGKSS